jgi:hypothetical protein
MYYFLMSFVHGWLIEDLPVLDDGPFESLYLNTDSEQSREQDNGLQTESLALVVLRLCSPVQEGDNIFGHLRCGGGGTVIVLDNAIKQDTSHGDGATREVRVVVHALTDLNTSGRINVTGQEREDVVRASMSGLNDQAEVRRESATVTSTRSLLVGVRSRQVIRKLSGALEHLSIVVWSVGVFNLLSQSSCLVSGMGHAN